MSNIIQIDNLNKSFGSVNAVRNLSFRVKKGELFAFLGINGAGKSTTINIMCGQLTKDSGSVVIDKHDLDEDMDYIKRELGVVFQSSVLDSALSVYDNLESRAALYGITGMAFKNRLEELAGAKESQALCCIAQHYVAGNAFDTDALLLFPERGSLEIVRRMLGRSEIQLDQITELEQDALGEIGNIIINSCMS